MAGPGLWPFVISGASGAVSGGCALAGVVLTLRRSERNEQARTREAAAAAVAAERHRLEQANLLDLQLCLSELATQTHVLAANISATVDPKKVSIELRFDWVAAQRRARALAQRVLDSDLRRTILLVIETLERSIIGETPGSVREASAAALVHPR